jgi:hypothetical protein
VKRRAFITLLGGAAAWPVGARAQHETTPTPTLRKSQVTQRGPQPFLALVKSEIARWTPIIQAHRRACPTIGFGVPLDANRPFYAETWNSGSAAHVERTNRALRKEASGSCASLAAMLKYIRPKSRYAVGQ